MIPITVKAHPTARRMTLRYQPHKKQFLLTTPKRTARRTIETFIAEQQTWMQAQQALYPTPQPIIPLRYLLFMGTPRQLIHQEMSGIDVCVEETQIIVRCRVERFERAVKRFLKQQAEAVITPLVHEKAGRINRSTKAIAFRDTTSRWGSCAPDGRLSFSWRLIMAPMETIDYVVAHEVAHLRHFDHSNKFWTLCRDLSMDFTRGKHWLQQHTAQLHTAF